MTEFPSNQANFSIKDFSCHELYAIVKTCNENSDSKFHRQIKYLFEKINYYWDATSVNGCDANDPNNLPLSCCLSAKMCVYKEREEDEESIEDDGGYTTHKKAHKEIDVPSSLAIFLRTKKWIPIIKICRENIQKTDIFSSNKAHKFSTRHVTGNYVGTDLLNMDTDTFVKTLALVSEVDVAKAGNALAIVGLCKHLYLYLGHHVAYTTLQAEHLSANMAQYLGIPTCVNTDLITRTFLSWCSSFKTNEMPYENNDESVEKVKFIDSYARITHVYKYLEENLNRKELKSIVNKFPIIFIRKFDETKQSSGSDIGEGVFVKGGSVCWSDDTGLLSKYCKEISQLNEYSLPSILSVLYPADLGNFLTDMCAVRMKPELLVYLDLLKHITSSSGVNQDTRHDVKAIFNHVKKYINNMDEMIEGSFITQMHASLQGRKIFPSKSNKWVSVYDRPALIDDASLEKVFALNMDVEMISLHEQEGILSQSKAKETRGAHRFANDFIRMFGVKGLTELVTIETVTEMYRPSKYLGDYFKSMLPYIQKCLFNVYPNIYNYLETEMKLNDFFQELNFAQVNFLF